MRLRACVLVGCLAVAVPSLAGEQASGTPADAMYFPAAGVQTEADEYTRYELLDPATASFKSSGFKFASLLKDIATSDAFYRTTAPQTGALDVPHPKLASDATGNQEVQK